MDARTPKDVMLGTGLARPAARDAAAERFAAPAPAPREYTASEASAAEAAVPAGSTGRDLRLDLFRGLALWFIFLNHIPNNALNWITTRNFGFSDATEIFVFISGYTAAMVYGRQMETSGVVVTSARIWRRSWQLYVAFIFLFVVYLAEISYVIGRFSNPLYAEEMGALQFLSEPDVALVQALLLKFRPANMDVLPLYIVLLAGFPPVLWALRRWPDVTLAASFAVYVGAGAVRLEPAGLSRRQDVVLQPVRLAVPVRVRRLVRRRRLGPAHPTGAFAHRGRRCGALSPGLAGGGGELVVAPARRPGAGGGGPPHLSDQQDRPRARAPRAFPGPGGRGGAAGAGEPRHRCARRVLRPMILCGQHSLEIFCFGVFLSFAAHFVLNEIVGSVFMQLALSLAGITLMVALSALLSWYSRVERGLAARKNL